jgi:hypothetical protein
MIGSLKTSDFRSFFQEFQHESVSQPGDRITTPTAATARYRSPWLMHHHALIAFDCGSMLWMPCEILCPETPAVLNPAPEKNEA